jgi:alanine racemase
MLRNLASFRKLVGRGKTIICIVKANAYGHGLPEVVKVLKNSKKIWFGVDNFEEALKVREITSKPVLILGYTPEIFLKKVVEKKVSFVVSDKKTLEYLVAKKFSKKALVHLKIETGLNRQGFGPKDLEEAALYIKKNPERIILQGVSTHFADIEDRDSSTFARRQLGIFNSRIKELAALGINPPFKHTAASAATLLYPETHFNAVRVGISLYGLWPSKKTKKAVNKLIGKDFSLKPVMEVKSLVAQIKKVGKGESVGYGRTWYAKRNTRIAIVPFGYYDGYDRGLSNKGFLLIKGKKAPIIGRVAMNMIVADVGKVKGVRQEDEVIILGKKDKLGATPDEIAEKIDTINYEVVARINPLLPRIVIR